MLPENANSDSAKNEQPKLLQLISLTRFISVIAVLSSLAGTLLMLLIGAKNTMSAFSMVWKDVTLPTETNSTEEATLLLLESLDNFLIGLAFLYFAYGIYSLFIDLGHHIKSETPEWLKVEDISQLKKKLLEVLIVLLNVIFVKRTLETVTLGNIEWQILVIPLSVLAIAASIALLSKAEDRKI